MKYLKYYFLASAGLLVGLWMYANMNEWIHPRIDFNTEIRPLLNSKCGNCHGGVKRNGGLSVISREALFSPNESGMPAIIPGKPGESELMRRIRHSDPELRMPLDKDPLTEEEIDLLNAWIRQGAPWEDHWAFVAPEEPKDPGSTFPDWERNYIDRYIGKRLGGAGLNPSPPADPYTLARRVSLDLTGLPPGEALLEAFLDASDPDQGYEDLVDALLEDPAFGERWASLWLDLARYADTKGYEKDPHRDIWPYRDWVIRAINADKPFDEFTIEQLAGDLLEAPTADQLIATAFHRNTMTNTEGGTDDEEFRVAAILDRVNTTFEVWQGLTIGCVQCHNHPYDPIDQEEYYAVMDYFNQTADSDKTDERPTFAAFPHESAEKAQTILAWLSQQDTSLHLSPDSSLMLQKKQAFAHRLFAGEASSSHNLRIRQAEGVQIAGSIVNGSYLKFQEVSLDGTKSLSIHYVAAVDSGIIEVHRGSPNGPLLAKFSLTATGDWAGNTQNAWRSMQADLPPMSGKADLFVVFKGAPGAGICDFQSLELHPFSLEAAREGPRKQYLAKQAELWQLQPVNTPIMRELPDSESRTTRVFNRGNWLVLGDTVVADVPGALPDFPADYPPNRLGFARWLVHENNPLTGRVSVNRFWEQIFGRGLVETTEDFGSQGHLPSHPQLLDALAWRFAHDHRWSIKSLLRDIVLSATYRQSAAVHQLHLEKDPANLLLARAPRVRLSAEQVRDQALAVSGLLSKKMYGPSVMPPQPEGIWQVVYSGAQWRTSEGEDRHRRGIYTYWRRTSPYPSMITFDSPSREFCVSRRIRTNTPLQALVTLNDPVYLEAAEALAEKMMEAGNTLENQIAAGYYLALRKPIRPEKAAVLTQLYQEALAEGKTVAMGGIGDMGGAGGGQAEKAALTVVANALLNLDGFIMKE